VSELPEADAAPDPASLPSKVAPHTLVLRGRPGRVVRFRRGVIVTLAALGVSIVAGAAWLALRPRTFEIVAQRDDASEPANGSADALGALPSSYAEAPQLGPPLPGDLGRPILARERSLDASDRAALADPQREAAEAERQRIADELREARQSALMAHSSATPALAHGPASAPQQPGPEAQAGRTAQTEKERFVATPDPGADVDPHRIEPAPSPYLLSAGSVIAASLVTGLRSDLPGLVIAQVTERVYDSPTGRLLLIPQGARLIGQYDSVVAFGQRRALIVWQRIIFPDGRSLRLDNVPATDAGGYAGLEDKVDFHTWTLLKGAALSTLLGVGANLTFSGESDLVEALRESAQQNTSRAGDQLISRNLSVHPTITIRPGTPVRLVVHRDLVLAPPDDRADDDEGPEARARPSSPS
jgi:type IV secretion system protein VirB10